jgi:hypothetical protein
VPEKDMEDALAWLRSMDGDVDISVVDPTGMFTWLDSAMPQKAGQSLEDRAKDFEKALSWMRSRGLNPEDDETGIPSLIRSITYWRYIVVHWIERRKWKTPSCGSETRMEMSMTLFLIQMVYLSGLTRRCL